VNGVDFTASFVPFRFSGLPSVARVAPSAGPLDGRTELTVTGSGFPATGELFCLVDGVLEDQPFAAGAHSFLYARAPAALSAWPSAGPSAGGTIVTFALSEPLSDPTGAQCSFGGITSAAAAAAPAASDGAGAAVLTLQCRSPSHQARPLPEFVSALACMPLPFWPPSFLVPAANVWQR